MTIVTMMTVTMVVFVVGDGVGGDGAIVVDGCVMV